MQVSVEISTYNNKALLKRVLNHLAEQTYPFEKFEVVLSDDGSTDGLIEMVCELIPMLPYDVRLLENEHLGAGHAHNRGVEACKHGLVIMLAADILATPGLIEGHVKGHTKNPEENVFIVGRLRQSPELPQNLVQQSWNIVVDKLFEKPKDDIQHGGFLVSNISFKRGFFIDHGMFMDDLPPVGQEDIELGYRLSSKGMRLIQVEGALGYHHHEVSLIGLAKRAYMQGYNYHHLEELVPELWIRCKTHHLTPKDGLPLYLKLMVKGWIRKGLVNTLTIKGIIFPLLRTAEGLSLPKPLVASLCGKVTLYCFHLGLADFEKGRKLDLDRVVAL